MTVLKHTILADWNSWFGRHDCGVNRFLGGGVFICHRPCSPRGNGSFCEYHGQTILPDMELTWRARFRSLLSLPKRIQRVLHDAWLDLKVALREQESTNPTCSVVRCGQQAIGLDGEDWHCLDHYGP